MAREGTANDQSRLLQYYQALYAAWGPQHWWPAETRFEVIIGAYLTQNTAWTNVELAVANLRKASTGSQRIATNKEHPKNLLSVDGIREVSLSRLERLIRPSGFFRQKARRLKTFVAFLDEMYGGSLDLLFSQPTDKLREQLLGLNGVGPETADSILLYAGNHPVFVVDAYTRRILERHGIVSEDADYEEIRELFQSSLEPIVHDQERNHWKELQLEGRIRGASHPPSAMSTASRTALVQVYNEMHGLIVGAGKNYCRKTKPACEQCPLREFLPPNHASSRAP
jgi:endonuclease III related protein